MTGDRVSEAMTYLGGKSVFWINLDRSTDRCRAFTSDVRPLFHHAFRVTALDWQSVSDERAFKFVESWNKMYSAHCRDGVFIHSPQSLARYQSQTAKANAAIVTSHVTALSHGIGSGLDRFLIAEDDIRPRDCLWKETIPAPPPDADVAIWSGGLPMMANRTDDKLYEAGQPLEWVLVKPAQRFNTLGAALYEVTRHAAYTIRYAVEHQPMGPFDHRWGFAFEVLKVYRLRPNAFAQTGQSVRNKSNRTPVVERTKVTT